MMPTLIMKVIGVRVDGKTLRHPEVAMILAPHLDRQVLIDEQVFQKLVKGGFLALDNNLTETLKERCNDGNRPQENGGEAI